MPHLIWWSATNNNSRGRPVRIASANPHKVRICLASQGVRHASAWSTALPLQVKKPINFLCHLPAKWTHRWRVYKLQPGISSQMNTHLWPSRTAKNPIWRNMMTCTYCSVLGLAHQSCEGWTTAAGRKWQLKAGTVVLKQQLDIFGRYTSCTEVGPWGV